MTRAIGERLSAAGSQLVIGHYNEFVPGTNGADDSTTGALFVVGNGYCPVNGHTEEDATRSNAMIVFADGTVSANNFAASNTGMLGKLLEFLATANTATTGTLKWTGAAWEIN